MKSPGMSIVCIIVMLVLATQFTFEAESAVSQRQTLTVLTCPESFKQESLKNRWKWSENKSYELGDGFWIGYSIDRLMSPNSHIGSCSSDDYGKPTLEMIITGKDLSAYTSVKGSETLRQTAERALKHLDGCDDVEEKIIKEVGIIFYFAGKQANIHDADRVVISTITNYVNLNNKPLIWLGKAKQNESVDLLAGEYRKAGKESLHDNLITAIALHEESPQSFTFLKGILGSKASDTLRKKAVFWISRRDFPETLDILRKTMRNDRSIKIRENALFWISQMKCDGATDTLIEMARKSDNPDLRKKAIFWLGQKASRKSLTALENVVYDDTATDIQKKAVFALYQMPDKEGLTGLIDIAKSHPKKEIRKQALFWLGQSEDPRALETIIEIVQGR